MRRTIRELVVAFVLLSVGLPCLAILFGVFVKPYRAGLTGPGHGDRAWQVRYAPDENLEPVDVALIDGARHVVDMAAYVLTDAPLIDALARAARRGVVVRILFDRDQLDDRPETPALIALQDVSNVSVRVKRRRVLMHLKSYQVDGRVLRTGSANFSAEGLRAQDNDLVVIADAGAAARFAARFEAMFTSAPTQ